MSEIVVVLDNIRSLHNVGSILRTCDGFGVRQLYAVGTTPYPGIDDDDRLPHVRRRANSQITKISLGAEKYVDTKYFELLGDATKELSLSGFNFWAIEQNSKSQTLENIKTKPSKLALIFGNEIEGVSDVKNCDKVAEIPMLGTKESFNVAVSVGIVLYHINNL